MPDPAGRASSSRLAGFGIGLSGGLADMVMPGQTQWTATRCVNMIARIWRGQATADKAENYQRHFTEHVAPHLKDLPGHRGAYLLRREDHGEVEFLAVTLWDSIESVQAFAGANPDAAVVEPEGRAALSRFDDFARHYDIAYNDTGSGSS